MAEKILFGSTRSPYLNKVLSGGKYLMVKKIEWDKKFDKFFEVHEKLKDEGAQLSISKLN